MTDGYTWNVLTIEFVIVYGIQSIVAKQFVSYL